MAVRLAARLPLSEARMGVMVVPMFPPRMMAHPRLKLIHPCEHMISVMANVAAELWATMVRTMPKMKKMITDQNPSVA